jgi:hypothetical protein
VERSREKYSTNSGELHILLLSLWFLVHNFVWLLPPQRFILSQSPGCRPASDCNDMDQHVQIHDGVDTIILMTKISNSKPNEFRI